MHPAHTQRKIWGEDIWGQSLFPSQLHYLRELFSQSNCLSKRDQGL